MRVQSVLCIFRKVKKSESKSQPSADEVFCPVGCVYSVKLKNLKANHNRSLRPFRRMAVVYIP